MQKHPLISFIKYTFYYKIPAYVLLTVLFLAIAVSSLALFAFNLISTLSFWILLLVDCGLYVFSIGVIDYRDFKKYDYAKGNQDNLKEANLKPGIEETLAEYEKRFEKLEKYSPVNLAILAVFIACAVTIALSLISKIFPK